MYYLVPTRPVPSQRLFTTVGGQGVTITLRQMGGYQYFNLEINGKKLCDSVLITDRTLLLRAPYLGFSGDFLSVDTQGEDFPAFTGWGNRFLLMWTDNGTA